MDHNTADNPASQSATADRADRPISTILAKAPPANVAAESATAPLPVASTNSSNRKRAVWREKRIQRVLALTSQKGTITNRDVRQTLRVKQSTATEYLHELVKRDKLRRERRGKGARYKVT